MTPTAPHLRTLPSKSFRHATAPACGMESGATALDFGVEERRADRRWPAKAMSLTADLGGVRVDLLDVSADGMALELPPSLGVPNGGDVNLELRQGNVAIGRVGLRVSHASPSAAGTRIGGRVVWTKILSSRTTRAPKPGDVVEVRDEDIRKRILERLARRASVALLRCESGRRIAGSVGAGIDSTLVFRPTEDTGERPSDQAVSLEVTLNGTEIVLDAVVQGGSVEGLTLSPTRVLSVGRRRCERVPLLPGIANLSWEDPLDPDTGISAVVVDLSAEGLAIEIPAGKKHLLPAAPAPVTLRLREVRIPLLAAVHSVRVMPDGSTIIGLRVNPLHSKDLLRLGRICQTLRFPSLLTRRQTDPRDVAELMRTSGYLDLRDGTTPSANWHASSGDEALGVDLVQRADNGALLGHLSCTRIYPRTWIYHQLATLGLRRDRVAYPLYLQLLEWIHTLSEGEGYLVAYFNQQKSWHQTMMGAFTRWAASEALSILAKLDRFEPAPGDTGRREGSVPGVTVREATAQELPFASDLARSLLPPLLADALHLGESSMSTATLCREHADAGLERSRTCLVVEVDGEIIGVAACETGASSLSLFNILNTAHVFFRELVSPAVARRAQGALLNGVREFYAARGVALPLIVSPPGNTRCAGDAGLAYAETMGAWVTSAEGLKQWRNYLHFEMGAFAGRGHRKERKQ